MSGRYNSSDSRLKPNTTLGGVNNATDYINLMGFGYVNEEGDPVVTDSLLQGGIVSPKFMIDLVLEHG